MSAATDLLKNEARLAHVEVTEAVTSMQKIGQRMALAYALMISGLAPLMAAVILILGEMWGGRYWLSSLVVAVAFSGTGLALYAFFTRKFKESMSLSATRRSVEMASDTVQNKIDQLKQTIGGSHGIRATI
jgi:uncharacterized membrane protein YqjE